MVRYIASLGKNKSFSLKAISMQLVTLFALTCPERISALALWISDCIVHPEGVSFKLSTLKNSFNAGNPAEAFFARFERDKKLCPIECFRKYLKLAANAFVSLSAIMAVVDWSSPSAFGTFYDKPFFNSDFAILC